MRWWTRAFRGGNARAPRTVDAAMQEALLAVLDRDLDRAEQQLTSAVRVDSSSVETYLALARLYRMRGEIGRAIRIHQNLLLRPDLHPTQRRVALADLAADFQQGGFLRRAIASHREVLAHDPRHVPSLRALVGMLSSLRDYPSALEFQRRLARLERRKGGAEAAALLVKMAEAAREEGRSDAARRALKQALRKDRACARAWRLLGELESARGRTKSAVSAWRRAAELDRREAASVFPRLEAAFSALGRSPDYLSFLRERIEEQPDAGAARVALARTLAAGGETDAAIAELRTRLDQRADDLEARCTLARILLAAHRDPDAIKEYAELVEVLARETTPELEESPE